MGGTLLVVDNSTVRRILTCADLAAAFGNVQSAASGAEALATCRGGQCDIVLITGAPDDMAIGDLVSSIRRDAPQPEPPGVIVAATGIGVGARAGLVAAGADAVFLPDQPPALLLARLRACLRGRDSAMAWPSPQLRDEMPNMDMPAMEEAARPFTHPPRVVISARKADLAPFWGRAATLGAGTMPTIISPAALGRGAPDIAEADVLILEARPGEHQQTRATIAQFRVTAGTRNAEMLLIAPDAFDPDLPQTVDFGASAVLIEPVDARELRLTVARLAQRRQGNRARLDALEKGLRASFTDPLTGLFNRRYIDAYLTRLGTMRGADAPEIAAALVDLDHFKRVNDTHGHQVGDAVLCGVASRLRRIVGDEGVVGRYGGEEFLVLLPGASPGTARAMAERLRRAVAAAPFWPGPDISETPVKITASVGLTFGRAGPGGTGQRLGQQLIGRADAALFAAKNGGRNIVHHRAPDT